MDSKRIILCGHGASGKDYLRRKFEKRGYKFAVSHTTRAMRDGEEDGVEYHFISELKFGVMSLSGAFMEHVNFNGNSYGLSNEEFENGDIAILNAAGIASLTTEQRWNSFVIFIDIPEGIRRQRLAGRISDEDVINRRINADNKEFDRFEDYDMIIYNPDF